MYDFVPIKKIELTDVIMCECGYEECLPGHSFGPGVKDYYIIHYILDGKGIFHLKDKSYNLTKGQGFLICPNTITYYKADMVNPWYYTWVGFNGIKAEWLLRQANLTMENPVFTYTKDDFVANCFLQMITTKNLEKSRELRLLGFLYEFLSQLIEGNNNNLPTNKENSKEIYVRKVVEYIEFNYSKKISVEGISKYVGLNRSYLCSLFKEYLNVSLQEYIIRFRINKACELMPNNLLSIGDISRSVGYDDPLHFSKIFKKIKGVSPKEYRKNITQHIHLKNIFK
ncbi:AraC family transcriptional regulator [Caldicellulosiruptoraceae bacterium PP1]